MKEQEKIINNKKKPVKTWKKIVLFFVAQVLLVTSFLMVYNVFAGTRITVATDYEYYSYQVDPFEKEECFEDTYIFDRMFQSTLENITVLSVVRNQMETNGVFDGKKMINISKYANRKNQTENEEATALFYLEDLLKWYKYGMEYTGQKVRIDNYNNPNYSPSYEVDTAETGEVTIALAEDMQLNIEPGYAYPNQSISGNDLGDKDGYYTPEIWMEQSIDYFTPYSNFYDIYGDEEGRVYGNVDILKCRYKTVDGKDLEELVNNWQDYFTLVHNLDVAMANLAINYESYQTYSKQYGEGMGNVKFCIRMTVDGEENYISNIPAFNGGMQSDKKITEYFTNEENKYLYYSPADMVYMTNTEIAEDSVFNMLTNQYVEYAYPETTKMWICFDSTYAVTDNFALAKTQYENTTSVPVGYLISAAILLLIYVLMMIYLCCKAGWEKNGDGEVVLFLNGFDRLHTEFVIVFAGLVVALGMFLWYVVLEGYDLVDGLIYNGIRWGANILLGSAVFVSGVVLGALLLSLARRIKGHNLWSDTLIMSVAGSLKEKWMESIHANRNSMTHNWGIYLLYLVINLVLIFVGLYFLFDTYVEVLGVLFLLAAVIFDIWVGFILMRNINERFHIINGINRIRDGEFSYQVTEEMHGENIILADAVNNIGDGIRKAVETSMKDERMKADLITNVSHDIKTPLTSIINYVDLLKREDIQDEKVKGYIEVLDSKSQRLKQLTEDLVEASKISSGNISYVFEKINLTELTNQAIGEFSEKFEMKGLQVVDNLAGQTAYIEADSRRMWRVIENLFNNIYKYALPNTRIYLTMVQETVGERDYVSLSVKNISAQPLNIDASELTERFIRGDVSRSTEGSGLGLSIAKNLTEAQQGKFEIYLDGDLFKVTLTFPTI